MPAADKSIVAGSASRLRGRVCASAFQGTAAMNNLELRFSTLAIRTIVVHTVTYFAMGLLALSLFDYPELYARPDLAALMRPVSDPLVMAGPLFQPLRG